MSTRDIAATQPPHFPGAAAAQLPIPGRELKITIYKRGFRFWEYEGTRAQLEAEGVIPPGTVWPQGKQKVEWCSGGASYWLGRKRPDGIKGPMSVWITGDWWCLRSTCLEDAWSIRQKRLEIARALYELSPEGCLVRAERLARYFEASQDSAFQAFKAAVVPQRKRPGRPAKTAVEVRYV
ncbi:hypothetical protein [Comamonas granuli]|uniref:hypothetical protein n=1 Tax=Comamonas granuli TaxID=290309 RepID=UPI0005A73DC1|nr:hypothetical protein [Comamonas granuli]